MCLFYQSCAKIEEFPNKITYIYKDYEKYCKDFKLKHEHLKQKFDSTKLNYWLLLYLLHLLILIHLISLILVILHYNI